MRCSDTRSLEVRRGCRGREIGEPWNRRALARPIFSGPATWMLPTARAATVGNICDLGVLLLNDAAFDDELVGVDVVAVDGPQCLLVGVMEEVLWCQLGQLVVEPVEQ